MAYGTDGTDGTQLTNDQQDLIRANQANAVEQGTVVAPSSSGDKPPSLNLTSGLKNPATGNPVQFDPSTGQFVDSVTGEPVDFTATDPRDVEIQRAENAYYQLWGVFPPPGYIGKLVDAGMNLFEIQDYERSKPAFNRTASYQQTRQDYSARLLQIMGVTP